MKLSAREISAGDIHELSNYWLSSSADYLRGMGADITLLPDKTSFENMLTEQINLPYPLKKSYCIIWMMDGQAVGHCNVNKIVYGEEAYMHLHLWNAEERKKGFGSRYVQMSVPYFFQNLRIKTLYSEPYALNPAPHKTLEKVGFTFKTEYVTVPGTINFEQPVKLWQLESSTFDRFHEDHQTGLAT